MNGCINIADFRCRALNGAPTFPQRHPRRPRGFDVDPRRGTELEMPEAAVVQEDPPVYDIGIVREAQRLRRRAGFRPISIAHKAKVLRFRNDDPVPIRMRGEERRGVESWSGAADGPLDPPPAA